MAPPKTDRASSSGNGSPRQPPKLGANLLELRDALVRAEYSRQRLMENGFSQQRWIEIVNDVNPGLRFAARPQVLDAIVIYLQGSGKPVSRRLLVRVVAIQTMWTFERIHHAINVSLRAGKLILFPRNAIGLPEWKQKG
jgi:hypothetical protein